MEATKKAYTEIMKLLKKYKDVCVFDVDELERKSNIHLFGLELKEKYGLKINPKEICSLDYVRFGEHKNISWWGQKYNRTISWPVDGRQPKDNLLFQIYFPTGAYIFGDDYPTDLFQKLWLELKSFNPDFIDEHNNGLYWKIKNAKDIFNSFDDILKKYYEINKEEFRLRRIEKMKKDLEQLEKHC